MSEHQLDALPARIDVPTAASILGVGVKKLRASFNGAQTARVQVGDQEYVITTLRLGRQRWVVTETVRRIFRARGP